MTDDLVERLKKRAEIRRQAKGRKSVENGEPDRISDLLEEASGHIQRLEFVLRYALKETAEYSDLENFDWPGLAEDVLPRKKE